MADKKSSLGASALNQISQFNAGVIDSTLGLLDLGAQGVAGVSNMITGRNDSPVVLSGRAKSALNVESNPNSVGYVAGSVAPAIATGVGAMAKQGASSIRNFLGGSTAELGGYYGGEAGAQLGRVYGGTAGEIVGGLAGGMTAPNAPRPQAIAAGHASPHEFEKFSMDKIGTGEGAQAYGHGLYFGENPKVIDEYFDNFNSPVLRFKERNVDTPYTGELRDRFKDVYEGLIDYDSAREWKDNVLGRAFDAGVDVDEVDDKLNILFKNVFEGTDSPRDFAEIDFDSLGIDPNEIYDLADQQRVLDNVLGGISQASSMDDLGYVIEGFAPDEMRLYRDLVEPELAEIRDSASRYDVNLNVDPDELLDWDATLSEQSEKVQKFWNNYLSDKEPDGIFKDIDGNIDQDTSGRLIYEALSGNGFSSDPVRSSQMLNEMGIKGIKYFDGNSRNSANGYINNVYQDADGWRSKIVVNNGAAATISMPFKTKEKAIDWAENKISKGTSNYVIFDDSLVDTKRVNDKLTPSWMDQGARMQRAQDLEFDTDRPLYHYTDKLEDGGDFNQLSISPDNVQTKLGRGIYTSPDNQYGDRYIRQGQDMSKAYGENARAIPVYARGKIATESDYETAYRSATENLNIKAQRGVVDANTKLNIRNNVQDEAQRILKDQGFTGAKFMDEVMIFDPKDVRSVNAEFDPTRADSADLLSSRQSERQMSALRGIV